MVIYGNLISPWKFVFGPSPIILFSLYSKLMVKDISELSPVPNNYLLIGPSSDGVVL